MVALWPLPGRPSVFTHSHFHHCGAVVCHTGRTMQLTHAGLRAALLSVFLAPAALASPATDVFGAVSSLLEHGYGGLSTADRAALLAQAQADLNAACARDAEGCPASAAYGVLKGTVAALHDQHTYLNTPEEEAKFQEVSTGSARLQFGFTSAALPDQTRVVTDVMPDSPAEGAGLQRGDHLTGLNGGPYDHAQLAKLREAGASVALTVRRGAQDLQLHMQARESSGRNLPHLRWEGSTAVIRIPTFSSGGGVAQQVHDLVRLARDHAATGIVVDLRDNPGGSLFECDLAATPFVARIQRSMEGSDGHHVMNADAGVWQVDGVTAASVSTPQRWDGPLAVLVNAHSASCSEFFALAVQGAHRGPVIGEATSGVGNTSTSTYRLPGGGALHLTRSHFARPDGQPYPERVQPDQGCTDDLQELAVGEDAMLALGVKAVQDAGRLASSVPGQQH